MLQDPNVSLVIIWGMVCIAAVLGTTVAYFFSFLNNYVERRYWKWKHKMKIDDTV